ncbi:sigma 54-interacting transcriptional regulator [Crenobacter sp. SG2303]|uniref:Sigma 54-interacting transcriptional regulator n=1 Tax=Crenobacter oryzisoli TaxID=3056844 RepID=A0ABT7XR07_9NEIS|nr:sigma 54-interacting transcriptional regulator [Crenobacter sp. SG2303]MDN0076219.1 sigma 54-interacting transcriptional regulator [Crenobacter sp. SG2303]
MDEQLASALAIFSEFLDSIPQPVAIVDSAGHYVYYNEESARLDDYKVEKALGNALLDVYPQMDKHSSTLLQSVYKGKRYHNKYQLYFNAAGKPVHQVHTTLPLNDRNGRIIGAIEMSRDLSVISNLHDQFVDLQQRLEGEHSYNDVGILTCDPAMQKLIHQANRLAKTDVQVLIYGETGTGKELFARLLHSQSERANKPFMVLNCAALPEPLFESALFGTVKGAFTGAEDRRGILETANGGTLFLDELNSMPMAIQGKLLRALQEKTFSRVGSSAECRVDVRIISATNESPQAMLDAKKIRPDLLYRLNVGYLVIPPLRERVNDIPLLAQALLKKNGKITGNRVKRISNAVMERLQRHHWPGNVRMLENIILRSLILCENGDELNFILLEDDEQPVPARHAEAASLQEVDAPMAAALPAVALAEDGSQSFDEQVEAFERGLLIQYLSRYPNLSEAARRCGLPRATLQYKMKKYGIKLAHSVVDA